MITSKKFLNSYLRVLKKEILDENGVFIKNLKKSLNSKNPYLILIDFFFLIHPIPRIIFRSFFRKKLSTQRIYNRNRVHLDQDDIGLISITHAGRSGSYVISNIFDNHSQIISLPPTPCFYEGPIELIKIIQRINFSSLKIFKKNKTFKRWWQNLLINFISENYKGLFSFGLNPSEDTGIIEFKNKNQIQNIKDNSWELMVFRENITKLILDFKNIPSPKELTLLIHYAYYQTLGIKFDKKKIKYIAWQRHRETDNFDVYLLNKYFKKIVFITPIRHPVCSLDSLIYSKQRVKESIDIVHYINLFLRLTNHSYPKEVGSQIFLRFEDLHEKSKEVITAIASILNIELKESLFKTTLNGKPYYFSSGNKLITGFNNNIFKKPIRLKALLTDDIIKIEESCKHLLKEFNYENINTNSSSLIKSIEDNEIKIFKRLNNKRTLVLGSKNYPFSS